MARLLPSVDISLLSHAAIARNPLTSPIRESDTIAERRQANQRSFLLQQQTSSHFDLRMKEVQCEEADERFKREQANRELVLTEKPILTTNQKPATHEQAMQFYRHELMRHCWYLRHIVQQTSVDCVTTEIGNILKSWQDDPVDYDAEVDLFSRSVQTEEESVVLRDIFKDVALTSHPPSTRPQYKKITSPKRKRSNEGQPITDSTVRVRRNKRTRITPANFQPLSTSPRRSERIQTRQTTSKSSSSVLGPENGDDGDISDINLSDLDEEYQSDGDESSDDSEKSDASED